MTRRVVYGVGIWVAIAATAMTLASIIEPKWISFKPDGPDAKFSYGLHRSCSSVTGHCKPFPSASECARSSTFCSMWRTTGFLMSFSVIIELASIVAYAVVILGGKQKRDQGWKITTGLLSVAALAQIVSMALVAYLFDTDERFFDGWVFDVSWILCTVSWATLVASVGGLVAAATFLPEEGDYELIPN